MEKLLAVIIAVVLTVLAAMGFVSIPMLMDKHECEKDGARCVWEADHEPG